MNRQPSRWTGKNIGKGIGAFFLGGFVAYFVFIIGLYAKKPKVIAEGALYAIVFSAMIALPSDFLGALPAFLGLGAMVASGVRSYQLRDLWLPLPNSPLRQGQIAHPPPYSQIGSRPYQDFTLQQPLVMPPPRVAQPVPRNLPQQAHPAARAAAFPPPMGQPMAQSMPQSAPQQGRQMPSSGSLDDLSSSLEWVTSTAKRNKQRLPSESYIAILEIAQELDALIDAERKSASNDASYEYELEAMATKYLPSVLKGYLAVPPAMIEQVQPNGKTPNTELIEQLDLLAGQSNVLYSNRYSNTTADLSTTGNFLRERFGHRKTEGFDFGVE